MNEELSTVSDDYQKRCANSVEVREHNKILLRLRDLEAKFAVETAQKQKAESLVESMKDEVETAQTTVSTAQSEKDREVEVARKAQKDRQELEMQIRDLKRRVEMITTQLEKERVIADQRDQEFRKINNDLKTANRRIEELQAALQADISVGDDFSESDDEAMGGDSIGDEEEHGDSLDDVQPLRNSTPKDGIQQKMMAT